MSNFIKIRAPSFPKVDSDKARRMSLIYPYYVSNCKKNETYNKIGKAEYQKAVRTLYNDWNLLVDFLADSTISSEIGAKIFEPYFANQINLDYFRVLQEGKAGFEPGIDCLVQEIKTGKIFVITLKCYHRNQNNLKEGSFSQAEAAKAKKENVPLIGILWNPFWKDLLCKYLDPENPERITWSFEEINSSEDLQLKEILHLQKMP
jgi:hypothetical protein